MTTTRTAQISRAAFLLFIVGLTEPAHAEQAIVHHVDMHPATPAAALRSARRIDEAALNVCGASGFSLAEFKAATRAGRCWQDAVGGVVRNSGDTLLAQAFVRFAPASR